jgi:hypothetical protein
MAPRDIAFNSVLGIMLTEAPSAPGVFEFDRHTVCGGGGLGTGWVYRVNGIIS